MNGQHRGLETMQQWPEDMASITTHLVVHITEYISYNHSNDNVIFFAFHSPVRRKNRLKDTAVSDNDFSSG